MHNGEGPGVLVAAVNAVRPVPAWLVSDRPHVDSKPRESSAPIAVGSMAADPNAQYWNCCVLALGAMPPHTTLMVFLHVPDALQVNPNDHDKLSEHRVGYVRFVTYISININTAKFASAVSGGKFTCSIVFYRMT